MTNIDLEDAVGSQDRERDDDERRAWDRIACVVFGEPTKRYRGWTGAQWWAHENHRFIGEHIDGPSYSDEAPCARPGIVRLAMSARHGLPGGVLIEQSSRHVDPLALAVVAECLAEVDCEMRFGKYGQRNNHVASPGDRAYWTSLAGGAGTVGEHVQALNDAVDLGLTKELSEFVKGWGDTSGWEKSEFLEVGRDIEEFAGLGQGPHRDVALARSVAVQRRTAGWNGARICRYLELYGFINQAGTVGVWGHDQFKALELGGADE
jgi:hypothetical protein